MMKPKYTQTKGNRKARIFMNVVKVYGFSSSIVLSGFMAWFFYTLDNGSVWLVSPDEWNGFEFVLSLLTCNTITLLIIDYMKNVFNRRASRKGFKILKVLETSVYGENFMVEFPVRFFFDKDGSFDGLDINTEHAPERDQALVKELCEKLSENWEY